MTVSQIDRSTGLTSSAAIKAPCYLATTANITLSGVQTIDGVSATAGKRVLVKDQTDASQNGIYIVGTGDWTRAPDFASNDSVREGTRVFVTDGSSQGIAEYVVTVADPISIGTSLITWASTVSLLSGAAMASAINSATAKTTPANADKFGFLDSVTGLLRQFTWQNMLTALGASFLALAGGTLSGTLTGTRFALDATSYFQLQSGNPLFGYDALDYSTYNRTTNEYNYNIGGAAVLGISGTRLNVPTGQISFPATQNASSDANTLDDYEEGTWTPGMTFGGSASGVTFAQNSGYYTKVGDLVFWAFQIALTNNGTGVGAAVVNNLPFTVSNNLNYGGYICRFQSTSGVVGVPFAILSAGGTSMNINMSSATGEAQMTDTNITNTSLLYMSGIYKV